MGRFMCLLLLLLSTLQQQLRSQDIFKLPLNKAYFDTAYAVGREFCCPHSIEIVSKAPVFGKPAIKFTLNDTDAIVASGTRAEIVFRPESKVKVERWYRFDLFIPERYENDPLEEIIAQWHEMPDFSRGENWRSPPISLMQKDDKWFLFLRWSADTVNTNATASAKRIELGNMEKEKWIQWIFHLKFSWEQDGLVEIWKNQEKILTYNGPNNYNDLVGNYFKLGIYKPQWTRRQWIQTASVHQKVLYYSNIRIGKENANFKTMTK